MKRTKIIAVFLSTVCMLGVIGCTADTTDDKVSISIGSWPNAEANPVENENYEKYKQEFNKKYPDIEIIEDEWKYDTQTFMPKAEGGTLPTLFPTFFTETKKIVSNGYAADLTDALMQWGYYDKLTDYVLENAVFDGKVYMIPQSAYTMGLVLNLDLFEQAGLMEEDGTPMVPETFEELEETAKIIYEKTGKAGFVFPTTENLGGWYFSILAWSYGTTFMEQQEDGWKATFNSEECAQALEYLKRLKWDDGVMPVNTIINNGELMKMIANGEAAMTFAHPGQIPMLTNTYNMNKDSVGMAKMPAGPAKHVTLMGGDFFVITNGATDEQIDAAFKWLELLGFSPNITEEGKQAYIDDVEAKKERGEIIGIEDISIWNEKAQSVDFKNQIKKDYINININHVKSYNDKTDIEYHVEEPVCAQDLYSLLDSCIQEVLNNKDADCKSLLEKAATDFQRNFLDYEK